MTLRTHYIRATGAAVRGMYVAFSGDASLGDRRGFTGLCSALMNRSFLCGITASVAVVSDRGPSRYTARVQSISSPFSRMNE